MGGKIKQSLRKLRHARIKSWILMLLLVPLGFIDATLLREDHIKMTELRDQVLAIDAKISDSTTAEDEQQIDDELKNALIALKEFTFGNIVINIIDDNGIQKVTFGTGPFYLEHQYLRAARHALEKAEKSLTSDNNPNGNIYGEAGAICKAAALENGWTWDNVNFINCMMTEINKYPSAAEIQDTIIAKLPSTELYRHNYASPIWAPTLTGFMLLSTAAIIIVIIIRFIIYIVLRLSLLFV